MRGPALNLLMRGEATPRELRAELQVSRQLLYYWVKSAGLRGKLIDARKDYIRRLLLKALPAAPGAEPEHPAIEALRMRAKRPRANREQVAAARKAARV